MKINTVLIQLISLVKLLIASYTFCFRAMETKKVIKFTDQKGAKRPKQLNKSGTLFGLFIPER